MSLTRKPPTAPAQPAPGRTSRTGPPSGLPGARPPAPPSAGAPPAAGAPGTVTARPLGPMAGAAVRKVDTVIMDLLHMELVNSYLQRASDPTKPLTPGEIETFRQEIEAIGSAAGARFFASESIHLTAFGPTDAVRFVCNGLWPCFFQNNISNLRSNRLDVFVMTDSAYRPFTWCSSMNDFAPSGGAHSVASQLMPYTWFACGAISGALAASGWKCKVTSEINKAPGCDFVVVILNV
ncbi:hypothetical protein H696_04989 [Fonticula alba]|uniref:Trafficking protein particle complex subunit n=1 Tax=Fonticula alba TaxID=691883 RepID=A0A058Z3I6_FONAL|nr:hypothetical protein H696_04989 [Fonticula alba]KCV68701.1 hypothetical protein H696_04989 [Fonticula alba]|eukprot:XP_009497133.1 hypothetical protein H696_04989 [Fonticula alba]